MLLHLNYYSFLWNTITYSRLFNHYKYV